MRGRSMITSICVSWLGRRVTPAIRRLCVLRRRTSGRIGRRMRVSGVDIRSCRTTWGATSSVHGVVPVSFLTMTFTFSLAFARASR